MCTHLLLINPEPTHSLSLDCRVAAQLNCMPLTNSAKQLRQIHIALMGKITLKNLEPGDTYEIQVRQSSGVSSYQLTIETE